MSDQSFVFFLPKDAKEKKLVAAILTHAAMSNLKTSNPDDALAKTAKIYNAIIEADIHSRD